MRTVLICHADAPIDRHGLTRWLGSFSDLVGIVEIAEPARRFLRRVRREIRRVGPVRFADVVAFRAYYRVMLRDRDRRWEADRVAELQAAYPPVAPDPPVLRVRSPNGPGVEDFLHEVRPDVMIARCKTLLRPGVFTVPAHGTFVLHPGICPEYRNAHGCFWALARNDDDNVGLTLLKIDRGIDTGPVYGHFRSVPDPAVRSHIVIQHQALLDNLDPVRDRLIEVARGQARPLDVAGRPSAEWGQPWLTAYVAWRRRVARGRTHARYTPVP